MKLLHLLLILLFSNTIIGQENGKSKSSAKIYERNEIKVVGVSVNLVPKINTANNELSPAVANNKLWVLAENKKATVSSYKLTTSLVNANGTNADAVDMVIPMDFPQPFGPFHVDAARNKIYFTSSPLGNGKPSAQFTIYQADIKGSSLSGAKAMDFCTPDANFQHPCMAADGKIIYYSSDKMGGKGGFDLYRSELVNGKWSAPINMGDSINTKGNEVFPTLGIGSSILFSSNQKGSMGGYDIFVSDISGESPVRNLGDMINSPEDDMSLIVENNAKSGYLVSSRKGGLGKYDIYKWNSGNTPLYKMKVGEFIMTQPLNNKGK